MNEMNEWTKWMNERNEWMNEMNEYLEKTCGVWSSQENNLKNISSFKTFKKYLKQNMLSDISS
jgi:hypothetical protein